MLNTLILHLCYKKAHSERNMQKLIISILALGLLLSGYANADLKQECIMTGVVSKNRSESDKPVYVAFHSIKRGEKATCSMARNKARGLKFSAPVNDPIKKAAIGSKVKYRYTENVEREQTWELIEVSR